MCLGANGGKECVVNMEIRQMLYFKEVVKQQSFPLAAKALYITPQALSKSMRSLQEEYQTEIFYRDHGKLELTDFGKVLYQEVSVLLEQFQTMENRLKNIASQENGNIRIACSHGILNGSFQEYFKLFQSRYPDIELEFIELPDTFAELAIENEEYDLGFSINTPLHSNVFESFLLKHYKLCAVVHPDHPLAYRTSISLKECAEYPIITKNRIFKNYIAMEECAKKQGIKLNYALQSPDEITWKKMVDLNQGVGIGTTYYPDGLVPSIPFVENDLNWDIHLIYKKAHHLSRSAILFINFLKTKTTK